MMRSILGRMAFKRAKVDGGMGEKNVLIVRIQHSQEQEGHHGEISESAPHAC